jgi:hypothetical protein
MALRAPVHVHLVIMAVAVTVLPVHTFAQEGVEVRAAKVCGGFGQQGGTFQGTFNVDNLSIRGNPNGTVTLKRDGVDLGQIQRGTYQDYTACLSQVIKLLLPQASSPTQPGNTTNAAERLNDALAATVFIQGRIGHPFSSGLVPAGNSVLGVNINPHFDAGARFFSSNSSYVVYSYRPQRSLIKGSSSFDSVIEAYVRADDGKLEGVRIYRNFAKVTRQEEQMPVRTLFYWLLGSIDRAPRQDGSRQAPTEDGSRQDHYHVPDNRRPDSRRLSKW